MTNDIENQLPEIVTHEQAIANVINILGIASIVSDERT